MRRKILGGVIIFFGLTAFSIASADYCTPETTLGNDGGDYVARVQLQNLDNVTTNNAVAPSYHIYYTGVNVPVLVTGQMYSITLRVGTLANQNAIIAWMDFNGDQIFSARERLGFTTGLLANQETTFSFTVPLTGAEGITRLRVRESFQGRVDDPCEVEFTYGESEDYNISIRGASAFFGGGRRILPVDYCPQGDTSASPYDTLCSGISASNGVLVGAVVNPSSDIQQPTITPVVTPPTEPLVIPITDADIYDRAFDNNLTSLSRENARLEDTIQRYEAAKIITQFAINVQKKTVTPDPVCAIQKFSDYGRFDTEMKNHIQSVCNLGLMGRTTNGMLSLFRPFDTLSAEELGIIIGRYLKQSASQPASNKRIDVLRFLNSVSAE